MELSTGSKAFIGLIAVLIVGVLGFLQWANAQLQPEEGIESVPVTFEVELGTSRGELSQQLEDADIIRDATTFDLFARQDGFFASLGAGTYELRTGMSAEEVIEVFRAGPQRADEDQFRIEEGLSLVLTLERVADQFDGITEADLEAVLSQRLDAGGNADGVLQIPEQLPEPSSFGPEVRYPFEGLLFPQTYRVDQGVTPQGVLQRTIDQLASELELVSPEEQQFLEDRGIGIYQAMVIASLIERETRVNEEREQVASVIYNRLDAEMPLQIDATVLYALGRWKDRVLTEDTTVESPYNTYQLAGLPPTPISGFGTASLRAALNPADTDFTYYVLTPACDGTHVFAASLDEHNANVAEFRAAGGCRDDG